jgi:hypothetical protein
MPARTWRSPLRLLQIGSLALPAAIIGIWGVVSWNTQQQEAFEQAHGNAELLREYSLRVLETQRNLLYEAEYLIEDVDVTPSASARCTSACSRSPGGCGSPSGSASSRPTGRFSAARRFRSPAGPTIAPISRP